MVVSPRCKKKKSLWSQINQFTLLAVEVDGTDVTLQCRIFENNLLCDHPFCTKLRKKNVKMTQEMLNLAQPYMTLEEKMTTRFDNPNSYIDASSDRPSRKESCWQKEDTDKGMYNRYKKWHLWIFTRIRFTKNVKMLISQKSGSDLLTLSRSHK